MGIEALLLSQVITISGSTGQVVTRQADGTLALEDAAGGGIGGSTGATDNAILRADGTGGATIQSSGVTISDNSEVLIVSGAVGAVPITIRAAASQTANLQEWQNSAGAILARVTPTQITFPSGSVVAGGANGIAFQGRETSGISVNDHNLAIRQDGVISLNLTHQQRSFRVPSDYKFGFAATTNNNSAIDTAYQRNAAGVIEVNNGTAGQFRDLIVRNFRMSSPSIVPASASATGTEGQVSWDADYIYICTATNTWKRVAIATW